MLDILKETELKKFKKGGKANKLSLENRLLMTLSYWREYRTYFHLGKSFGISVLILSKTLDKIKKIINMTIWKRIWWKIIIVL
ncbi:helix-turn-helix domain-containing protein [Spiroplasma endosymbiont of Polydrusus pterygomalis]|uniref:helix-turn-helix domain-containing protein n=1 Tax=Spiroplasma endosymbiont of Polydrusus pterygomalis TaxID=3139327 RepID=UPI003CCB114E